MNQTKFPRRISFGKCAVGEAYTKHVSLTCNVPIDFEYEISLLQPNAAYVVQPHKGVVPANGTVDVEVIFCPARLVTEMAELEVRFLPHIEMPQLKSHPIYFCPKQHLCCSLLHISSLWPPQMTRTISLHPYGGGHLLTYINVALALHFWTHAHRKEAVCQNCSHSGKSCIHT